MDDNPYLRRIPGTEFDIDVYDVLRAFAVTDPALQHAVKKLLADGSGDKDRNQNIHEAGLSLNRYFERMVNK